MPRVRSHTTFANVTSVIALFVSLGGTAAAAITITGGQIVNGTLTSADVKNETLTSSDVKDGSLGTADLKNGTVGGMDVRDGSITGMEVQDGSLTAADFAGGMLPAGAPGAPGAPGPPGPSGATNVGVARTELVVGGNSQAGGSATCPAGQRATGGGVGAANFSPTDQVIHSGPVDADLNFSTITTGETPTGWYVRYFNAEFQVKPIQIYAICAAP